MTKRERLLYELPDFIMGKAPEPLAREIERLIETDSNFHAEYDALRKTMSQIKQFSETAFERAPSLNLPPFYFETFADRVQRRLATKPQSLWEKCLDALQTLFGAEQRYQLAGALAGAAMAFLMILAVSRLDVHAVAQAERLAQSQSEHAAPSASLAATIHYAASLSPELLIGALSEEEATSLLNAMARDLGDEEKFKTLSEEEAKLLMQM